ncbi:hypothetical protein [Paratractidigestivibacter sp.]|uniref:hypothetical protein n=1 Tax=Paratractidigestivibacter sp. TaxID=2847316 RepID=UPI002ABDBA38|nr:hypothetical protein [Paratractidigestivibacter sp.]
MTNPVQHGPVEATETTRPAIYGKRDELLAELCGLGATMTGAMAAVPGFVPCGHAFGVVIDGLYASVACGSVEQLDQIIEAVHDRSEHVSAHRGVEAGAVAAPACDTPEAALLLAAVRGMAADVYCAMELGRMDDDVDVLLANALAALGAGSVDHELLTRAGAAAVRAAEMAR